jgi:DNA-binding NtrC family response regulator
MTPEASRRAAPRKTSTDCVFLTCLDSDFAVFHSLMRSYGIRMHRARTLDEADFLLTVTEAAVLLSETVFLDGAWMDAARMLANVHPSVRLLVLMDTVETACSAEAVRRTACTVISKPIHLNELRRAIRAAAPSETPSSRP